MLFCVSDFLTGNSKNGVNVFYSTPMDKTPSFQVTEIAFLWTVFLTPALYDIIEFHYMVIFSRQCVTTGARAPAVISKTEVDNYADPSLCVFHADGSASALYKAFCYCSQDFSKEMQFWLWGNDDHGSLYAVSFSGPAREWMYQRFKSNGWKWE